MKISYKNYPVLEKLHKESLGVIPTFEGDQYFFALHGDAVARNWKFYCNDFKQEINVISAPFYEASVKARIKLMQLWEDIAVNDTSDMIVKGCYIQGDFVYMLSYEIRKGSEDNELAFYMFDKNGIPLAMLIDSAKYKIYENGWISSCFSVHKSRPAIQEWLYVTMAKVIMFAMFKSYAEVETKVIPPNSKRVDIGCKYINDTKLTLTHLDSKWFTNLVKSDGFNVRGHFRLQPKKERGRWTKELIWINEFRKLGYTAPARKAALTI